MDVLRRTLLTGAGAVAVLAAAARPQALAEAASAPAGRGGDFGLVPDAPDEQTGKLQAAIDRCAERGVALALEPGTYRTSTLTLRDGSQLIGAPSATRLLLARPGRLIRTDSGRHVRLEGLIFDGGRQAGARMQHSGLVMLTDVERVAVRDVAIGRTFAHGLSLVRCGGDVRDTAVTDIGEAGIFALDGKALRIERNAVDGCANNGILVWQSAIRNDGAVVAGNRISRIRAAGGGTGQNGNGVNVFRAGTVTVRDNLITDCAYSAVRGNSASNIMIRGNQASRIGEVALYAEFSFQGAVIAANIVDTAATGVSVTNFSQGGRLAVIHGNLIRNLFRRETEPVDKRGNGIAVEADAAVSGNVVESAPTAGISIGWYRHMRDVAVTGNVIRDSRLGIGVTGDPAAGRALIANNVISGSRSGAIRRLDGDAAVGPELHGQGVTGRLMITGNQVG